MWGRTVEWFLAPQPQHALVAARWIFGLCLFGAYAARLPVALDLFGPSGFGGRDFYGRLPDAPPLDLDPAAALHLLRLIPSDSVLLGLYALLLLSSLAFACGALTRWTGAAALVLHVLFYVRNPYAYNGVWAEFITAPLLYTVLAPTGRHASIDAWLAHRRGRGVASWLGPGWPLRLMQINTATLYLTAGLSRIDKASWLSGELAFIALSSATHSRFVIDWRPFLPLLQLATWGALVLEALAPFMFWLRGMGRYWALALIAFHLGLEVTLNVGMWSFVAIGCLLSFVLPWPEGRPTTRRPESANP